jgi:inner membrane protein
MASAFSHPVAAAAIGVAVCRPGWPARVWVLGPAGSILPDVDVIGIPLGVPFGSVLGHRGLSHSVVFAGACAAIVVALFFRQPPASVSRPWLWSYFFLAIGSHGVLDALTNGGPGVAFFAPLDDTRYFLPFRPVVVSPIGIRPFFSVWGLRVIESELTWIWLPSLIFAGLVLVVRRRVEDGASG